MVSKAKLLEEELNRQRLKAHEDKLQHFEELRVKEQQERELERKHQGVQREQEQLAEQQKLLRHQLEATKLKQEQYHKSQLLQKQSEPKPEQYHHNKRVRTLCIIMMCMYVRTYVYESFMHEVEL